MRLGATALGKLALPPRLEAASEEGTCTNRLHVFDRANGQRFLIDTGAEVSVVAATPAQKLFPIGLKLYAANNIRIDTYGTRRITLDLGLRRKFSWNFRIAAVPYPIIGADFLKFYGLDVSLKDNRLIDNTTKLHTIGSVKAAPNLQLSPVNHSNQFARILTGYPDLTGKKCHAMFGQQMLRIRSKPPDSRSRNVPDACPPRN